MRKRVLRKRFGTVRAAFRETLNPCPKTLFVIEDEHDILPLFRSIAYTCVGDLREKYTSTALSDGSLRWLVFPQRTSANMCTPGLDQVSRTEMQRAASRQRRQEQGEAHR